MIDGLQNLSSDLDGTFGSTSLIDSTDSSESIHSILGYVIGLVKRGLAMFQTDICKDVGVRLDPPHKLDTVTSIRRIQQEPVMIVYSTHLIISEY